MKRIIISVSAVVVLVLSGLLLSGYGNSIDLPTIKLDELSLDDIFQEIIAEAEIQEDTIELVSLKLHTDETLTLDSLSMSFYAVTGTPEHPRSMFFRSVEMNEHGTLHWEYSENTFDAGGYPLLRYNPDTLAEIEQAVLASLEPGENGLSVQICPQSGSIGYHRPTLELYALEDGQSVPLESVVFHGNQSWLEISVYQLAEGTSETAQQGEAGTTRMWFMADDLYQAEVVRQ
jgi:hypothetical protein